MSPHYSDTIPLVEINSVLHHINNNPATNTYPYPSKSPRFHSVPVIIAGFALLYRHQDFFFSKYDIQQYTREQFPHYNTKLDGYLQYLPITAPLVLDLFKLKPANKPSLRNTLMLESTLTTLIVSVIIKNSCKDTRPDGDGFNSFPSGHTAMAFTGAAILDYEYGRRYPVIKWAGYFIASGVAISRILNNRHWTSDILGGVALGMMSADFIYWLNRKKIRHNYNPPVKL
jgi:hypothetical protein